MQVVVGSPAGSHGGGLSFKHFHSLFVYSPSSPSSSTSSLNSKRCHSFRMPKIGSTIDYGRVRSLTVRASGNSNEDLAPNAPVELESAVGQLLMQILKTHPHLLPATADQQLEELRNQKEALKKETPSSKDLLYKRIAEVKEKERRKTLEEIIYCLVVHRFVDSNILMIPRIKPTSDPTGRVDLWPNQEQNLEAVHSSEAFEMIQSHLSIVLGDQMMGPLNSITQISKIKLGKLYAASVMYGYFLRRVDERYQLERTMNTLPKDMEKSQRRYEEPSPPYPLWDPDDLIRIQPEDGDSEDNYYMDVDEENSSRLRAYVMYLDADTLQRYAKIRSKEAMSLIEKQTQALFGRPDIKVLGDGTLDASNDEELSLTFSGMAMLVLEAVAFGSFLWDAESYTESKYQFIHV